MLLFVRPEVTLYSDQRNSTIIGMFSLVAHPTKANHQEVYIFRGLLPELRCVCCDGPVPVVFLVSSKLGDDWNY